MIWNEAKNSTFTANSAQKRPEFVAARASLIHTDPETGESYQTYAVSRPKGRNLFYLDEAELAARYRLVPKVKSERLVERGSRENSAVC